MAAGSQQVLLPGTDSDTGWDFAAEVAAENHIDSLPDHRPLTSCHTDWDSAAEAVGVQAHTD